MAILINAEVTTSGRAEAILKGTHVTRICYAHQATILSLSILRNEAYLKYIKSYQENNNEIQSFEAWSNQKEKTLPHFKYWLTVYDMEPLLSLFVRSIRIEDFDLYLRSLDEIEDWAFILNHCN